MSARISPEARLATSAESDRISEARFFSLDSALYVRFGDGLERVVRWADLPFARRLGLEPVAASAHPSGEAVVLGDGAGSTADVSGESLRAALDERYRASLQAVDDRERRQVGARLRAVRESVDLSQLELSRRSGIAQESLSRIETGRSDPRLGTLRRLARGMDLSLDQLLERLSVCESKPATT
jgi:DNA-binding XRE family transcriptional regulator